MDKHLTYFMNVLNQSVLVLNRLWQAVNETTVRVALGDCAKGERLIIDSETMNPLRWDDWINLPVRDCDLGVRTAHRSIRAPRVVIVPNFERMIMRTLKFTNDNVGRRDGYICGYTGVYCPDGNVDHIVPRGQNGRNSWDNVVWSDRRINAMKDNRTPQQAGLRLIRKPRKPPRMPACALIELKHPEWKPFLTKGQ